MAKDLRKFKTYKTLERSQQRRIVRMEAERTTQEQLEEYLRYENNRTITRA